MRYKTNLAIFITFFSIVAIFTAVHLPMQKRQFRSKTEKIEILLKTMIQRDQEPLAKEILDKNIRAINSRLGVMMRVNGMLAVSVFDVKGSLLTQESSNPGVYDLKCLEGGSEIEKIQWGKTDALIYLNKITIMGKTIGWIRTCYSLEEIKIEERFISRFIGGVLVSVLLVMLAVLNLILSITILRPITFLRNAMEQIGREGSCEDVDITSRDEIGDLTRSFNRMSGDLATFHREIEERQKETNEVRLFLQNIIDSMPSVLVGIDREKMITHWNLEAKKMTGLSSDMATGMAFDKVFTWKGLPVSAIEKSLNEKEIHKLIKIPVTINETAHFLNMTVYPLESMDKKGAVIRIDDITDHVRMEEMVIQSEKMLSVGGLAAGMAHEINNPLAGILQSAAVIKNRLKADLPANHRAAEACHTNMATIRSFMEQRQIFPLLNNIHQAGTRAAEIVKDMLGFTRKAGDKFSYYSLNQLLDETINLISSDYNLKNHFDFKQILIKKEYDPDLPSLPCDKGKLQQVFFNVLQNGAHAMAEKPKKAPPAQFTIRTKNCGKKIQVEIEDNGPGISQELCKRVFEPFFTTKPVGIGTGLGLSVSYFIIAENHRGSMEVESVLGSKTNFIIRLPIQQEEQP